MINFQKIFFYTILFLFSNCTDYHRVKNNKLKVEYPYILRSESMNGTVDSIFTYDMDTPKGGLYIKLKNGYKFVTIRNSYPNFIFDDNEQKSLSLENILMKGDSIFKLSNKDSLYILKPNGYNYIYFLPTQEYIDSIFPSGNYSIYR